MSPASSSLTFSAYSRIRTDVLAGRLAPGQKLKINDLCESLGVSLSAVREALSRLTSENLVVAEPQRGFRVAPISADEVRDLMAVRTEIERMCLARAIAKGTVDWEAEILGSLHQLNRTPFNPKQLSEEWTSAHARFHRALVSARDSQWLLRIREQLFTQGERYRWINVRMSPKGRDLCAEHRALAQAVIDRDVKRASNLMAAHLEATVKLTLQSLAALPPKRRTRH